MRLIDADDAIRKMESTMDMQDLYLPIHFKEVIDEVPTVEERKTGRWVKVGGYATPGGDPVWCCSECGKGLHVYGIEHGTYGKDVADAQWVACPNCGARMEEESDGGNS